MKNERKLNDLIKYAIEDAKAQRQNALAYWKCGKCKPRVNEVPTEAEIDACIAELEKELDS